MIITGHTARIGKYLYEMFPGSVGMSRSNGWNIGDTAKIVEFAKDHEIFINNAHGQGFQQTELLMSLFEAYRDHDKLIINIGSDAAYSSKWSVVYENYPIAKSTLNAATERLQNLSHKCRISLIEPNDIKVNGIKPIYDSIQFILSQSSVEIKNIRFHGRKDG
jgi:hypothetical protein